MNPADEQVDLRVRRTRKLLWEALMAELAERPFADITVGDICRRAMVHRTTFYKHYQDKYDLLEQGMRQVIDTLMAEHEPLPPSAYSLEDPPPYFIRLFEYAAEHEQFFRVMLCGEGIGPFERQIKAYVVGALSARLHEGAPIGSRPPIPTEMHIQFMAGAAISVLAWWLDNDMPLSPLQMAQYLLSPHGLPTGPGS